MHRPQARPQVLVAAGAAALLLLLSGCSEGSDDINENRPDDQPQTEQQLVPRTPGPLPSDENLETPPLVVPLPGPTGGTPGVAPSTNQTSKAADSDRTGNNQVPLAVSPCRSLCDWRRSRASYDGLPLFSCAGCGSQWVRTEPWAPRQADGGWPPGVREELLTSAPPAGAAGSAGSCTTTGS